MNLVCRIFGHSWKLKWRCSGKPYQSMKCRVCGKVLLVKGRIDEHSK